MRWLAYCCLAGWLVSLTAGTAGAEKTRPPSDLSQYRWQNRLLLLFAPAGTDPAYQSLAAELERQAAGVRERDLLVFRVLESGRSVLNSRELAPGEADQLRRRFGPRRGVFTVVLVGKDGTVKLQREGPTALGDIFGLIDGMPMRQQEMKGQ